MSCTHISFCACNRVIRTRTVIRDTCFIGTPMKEAPGSALIGATVCPHGGFLNSAGGVEATRTA